MADNATASSASWASPGQGVTGGYQGDSVTLKIFICFFAGLAMYNAVELAFMIFLTFQRYRGLYFWSLLISGLGIIPYALGFLLKFMNLAPGNLKWLAVTLLTIGWYPMITGQALVLWSRLHLIVTGARGEKIVRWTKWMIIIDAICLHIPTTVLTYGSNGEPHTAATNTFVTGYNVMEKIQMSGFFCQEVILSSIYIFETSKILKSSLQPNTRKTMQQLIIINVIIIILDLLLLSLEAASLYILETLFKGVLYSIKLKLEFAILGKLVNFVGGNRADSMPRQASVGFVSTNANGDKGDKASSTGIDQDMNLDEFVDLSKVQTDHTHVSLPSEVAQSRRKNARLRGMDYEFDFARFEHEESATVLPDRVSSEHIEDVTDTRESSFSHDSLRVPNGHV